MFSYNRHYYYFRFRHIGAWVPLLFSLIIILPLVAFQFSVRLLLIDKWANIGCFHLLLKKDEEGEGEGGGGGGGGGGTLKR